MNKSMTRLCLLLTTTALCGCSQLFPKVGPDYQKPELVLPSNWFDATPANNQQTASDSDRGLAQWWQQLGDAQLDQLNHPSR